MCAEQMLDVVVKIAQVAIALFAALGAFRFYECWTRPKLRVEFDALNGQDIQRYKIDRSPPSLLDYEIWIRARVVNNGMRAAKNVEVVLTNLEIKREGRFEPIEGFISINLPWTHMKNPEMQKAFPLANPLYLSYITPRIRKHFDVAKIDAKDGAIIELAIITQPVNEFWKLNIGEYRLEITVGASNVGKPTRSRFLLNFRSAYNIFEQQNHRIFSDYFELTECS